MNTPNNNEQIDDDILECKKDVLRASDIIPSASKKTPQSPTSSAEEAHKAEPEKTSKSSDKAVKSKGAAQPTAGIPRFDLAEEIMAEQRKLTAVRRKAPDKKVETPKQPEVKPTKHAIERPIPQRPEQDQIIAEIVSRDIERLCRG